MKKKRGLTLIILTELEKLLEKMNENSVFSELKCLCDMCSTGQNLRNLFLKKMSVMRCSHMHEYANILNLTHNKVNVL